MESMAHTPLIVQYRGGEIISRICSHLFEMGSIGCKETACCVMLATRSWKLQIREGVSGRRDKHQSTLRVWASKL